MNKNCSRWEGVYDSKQIMGIKNQGPIESAQLSVEDEIFIGSLVAYMAYRVVACTKARQ